MYLQLVTDKLKYEMNTCVCIVYEKGIITIFFSKVLITHVYRILCISNVFIFEKIAHHDSFSIIPISACDRKYEENFANIEAE